MRASRLLLALTLSFVAGAGCSLVIDSDKYTEGSAQACTGPEDCASEGLAFCLNAICVECLSDTDCMGAPAGPTCLDNFCVECADNADCGPGAQCDQMSNTCEAVTCTGCAPDEVCEQDVCLDCDRDDDGFFRGEEVCAGLDPGAPADCDDEAPALFPGRWPVCGDGAQQSCPNLAANLGQIEGTAEAGLLETELVHQFADAATPTAHLSAMALFPDRSQPGLWSLSWLDGGMPQRMILGEPAMAGAESFELGAVVSLPELVANGPGMYPYDTALAYSTATDGDVTFHAIVGQVSDTMRSVAVFTEDHGQDAAENSSATEADLLSGTILPYVDNLPIDSGFTAASFSMGAQRLRAFATPADAAESPALLTQPAANISQDPTTGLDTSGDIVFMHGEGSTSAVAWRPRPTSSLIDDVLTVDLMGLELVAPIRATPIEPGVHVIAVPISFGFVMVVADCTDAPDSLEQCVVSSPAGPFGSGRLSQSYEIGAVGDTVVVAFADRGPDGDLPPRVVVQPVRVLRMDGGDPELMATPSYVALDPASLGAIPTTIGDIALAGSFLPGESTRELMVAAAVKVDGVEPWQIYASAVRYCSAL